MFLPHWWHTLNNSEKGKDVCFCPARTVVERLSVGEQGVWRQFLQKMTEIRLHLWPHTITQHRQTGSRVRVSVSASRRWNGPFRFCSTSDVKSRAEDHSTLASPLKCSDGQNSLFKPSERSLWPNKPWGRYVDDIFLLWSGSESELKESHNFLNSINSNSKLSLEFIAVYQFSVSYHH